MEPEGKKDALINTKTQKSKKKIDQQTIVSNLLSSFKENLLSLHSTNLMLTDVKH
jgi:hypothetical protein